MEEAARLSSACTEVWLLVFYHYYVEDYAKVSTTMKNLFVIVFAVAIVAAADEEPLVIALAVAILAMAGQAMGEDISRILPTAFNYNGEGIQDASGRRLRYTARLGSSC